MCSGSCNGPLITWKPRLHLRPVVPVRELGQWTLRPYFFFFFLYKAVSNTILLLLDNPDTVHLQQQQGGWVSFQFSLSLCAVRSVRLSGTQSQCSSILREDNKGHIACGPAKTRKKKTLAVTQRSFNPRFSDLGENNHAWVRRLTEGRVFQARPPTLGTEFSEEVFYFLDGWTEFVRGILCRLPAGP